MSADRAQLICLACRRPRTHAAPHPTVCPSCGTIEPWRAREGTAPSSASDTERSPPPGLEVVDVTNRQVVPPRLIETGYAGADRVLAGGLRATRFVLIEGRRGSGKSRWLRRIACTTRGLYFDLEESADDHALRCRDEIEGRPCEFASTMSRGMRGIEAVVSALDSRRWPVVVLNSFQALVGESPLVQTEAAQRLASAVRQSDSCLVVSSQMNASGEARGSKTIEQFCDTILAMERTAGSNRVRLSCPEKHRDGESIGVAWYVHGQRFEEDKPS